MRRRIARLRAVSAVLGVIVGLSLWSCSRGCASSRSPVAATLVVDSRTLLIRMAELRCR